MIKQKTQNPFLPTSVKEMQELGWEQADVILFSGDAYVDHPSFGTAIIARILEAEGLQVAVVSQPNWRDDLRDFKKLGEPRLFFGVTAGSMDSMVNHYTAGKRKRSDDAYTPDGRPGQRPDDASIVYCNILKDIFPEVPIVLGGVEASLRRFTHYDYWKDAVRPTILEESKADLLTFGMGEKPMQDIVRLMQKGVPFHSLTTIPQTAYLTENVPQHKQWEDISLHSFASNNADKRIFAQDFRTVEENGNSYQAIRFLQPHGEQTLVVNPSNPPMETKAIDAVYDLPYTRMPHPRYEGKRIPAFDMIKNSVSTHRGCFGGCSFCAIYSHQGKFISSRSKESIMREVDQMVTAKDFSGTISDLGGPSANMYQMAGVDLEQCKTCRRVSCVYPRICKNLNTDHQPTTDLFRAAAAKENVKHCYVASGIRHDMLIDEKGSPLSRDKATYLKEMITEHTSGRLTVAPEHTSDKVLKLMRKPSFKYFEAFEKVFKRTVEKAGKKFQLVPYFISAHPGSEPEDMAELAVVAKSQSLYLEQVQDFTPTPMSLATTMYYTGINPYNSDPVYVAKSREEKISQKRFFFWYNKEVKEEIRTELRRMGRNDLEKKLFEYKPREDDGDSKGKSNSKGKTETMGRGRNESKGRGRADERSGSRSEGKKESRGGRRSDSKSEGKKEFRGNRRSEDQPSFKTEGKRLFRGNSRSDDKPSFRSEGRGESKGNSRSNDKPSFKSEGKREFRGDRRSDDKPSFKREGKSDSRGRGRSDDKPSFKSEGKREFRGDRRSDDKPSFKREGKSEFRGKGRSDDKPAFKSEGKREFRGDRRSDDKPSFKREGKSESRGYGGSDSKPSGRGEGKRESRGNGRSDDKPKFSREGRDSSSSRSKPSFDKKRRR